jgi:5-methylcytosine-specific restriction enzyme A
LRTRFLQDHPLCACGARAVDIDHVVPHAGNMSLFWDWDNLAAMCKRCHGQKSARERSGHL